MEKILNNPIGYTTAWLLLVGAATLGLYVVLVWFVVPPMDFADKCHQAGGTIIRSGQCVQEIKVP